MKSKTSESLIASESKAGFKKDGADQPKQKLLKKGKDRMLAVKTEKKFLFCDHRDANKPLFLLLRRSAFVRDRYRQFG